MNIDLNVISKKEIKQYGINILGEIKTKREALNKQPCVSYILEDVKSEEFKDTKHIFTKRIIVIYRAWSIKYTEIRLTANYQKQYHAFLNSLIFKNLVFRTIALHPKKSTYHGLSLEPTYEKLATYTNNPIPFQGGLVNPR